jgi:hypothetical protein
MQASPTLSRAPDFAQRLGAILASLAALVARRFLRDPFRAALIVPLWTHLTRAARRLDRAFAHLAAAHVQAPKPSRPRPGGSHLKPALPTRRGWLVAALGPEAAAYASQIESLLAEPAAAAALAGSLAARRTLAPIRRMLGLAASRPRKRRPRVRPLPPPAPAAARPTPPPWLRDPPPSRTARPWWLPPRRHRSGWTGPPERPPVKPSDTPRSARR